MRFLRDITAFVSSSLKLKLVLCVLAILGLTVGGAPWGALRMQERQLLTTSQEHLAAMQDLLKSVVAATMIAGDPEDVQRVIEAVAHHEDIQQVRILDTNGVVRFSSVLEERGRRLSAEELSRYHGRTDPVFLTRERGVLTHTLLQPMFNQPACYACHPAEKKVLGIIQVSVSLERTWQQLEGLRKSAFLATVLALAIVVAGIWILFRFFIDAPLQELVSVMGRAAKGDLGVRAARAGSDEIGQLSGDFNDMISKLETAQRELEEYHREQLARSERLASMGEMAAAMAHEIRNPLTGISGALSVMARDFPADDSRREIVRQIQLLIERLNRSVRHILDYARPPVPQLQEVDLDHVVSHSVALVESEAQKAGVRIVRETRPGANGAGGCVVAVDPQQIQQVLLNVLLNAIQASASGGQITIRAQAAPGDGDCPLACVEIADSGKGMTSEELANAFRPFFSTKPHGTGLGLPIARQIVEQNRGEMDLSSAPGEGTRVRVRLPLARPADRQDAQSPPSGAGG